jgi:hypothetical protein
MDPGVICGSFSLFAFASRFFSFLASEFLILSLTLFLPFSHRLCLTLFTLMQFTQFGLLESFQIVVLHFLLVLLEFILDLHHRLRARLLQLNRTRLRFTFCYRAKSIR